MHRIFCHFRRTLSDCTHINQLSNPVSKVMASTSAPVHGENKGNPPKDDKTHSNRLSEEKSPYLLQHATNPVDWYPWGEEAFKAASEENKLIFLSVGYSTCHWCHVMERESFENEAVAKVMNKYFINIKVDREERPDVDKVYMSFVTSMSGSGGWPMSVWLTPELHPVYGGTYFPPNNQYYGRPGFTAVLESLAKQWTSEETKIRNSGIAIVKVLRKNAGLPKAGGDDSTSSDSDEDAEGRQSGAAITCLSQLSRTYEAQYGGFSEAPKFPQPSNLNFLFAYYILHPDLDEAKKGRSMALHTLKMMARGGIHDHIAQGFARYSTDKSWHVPHFEKMLYDQAQLVHAYLDAFLVTRHQEFADVARDILQYTMRDLSHESGGFFSAEDADSLPTHEGKDKKEGAFCVWTHREIDELLAGLTIREEAGSATVMELFCHHYSVVEEGNVDPHKDPHDELRQQNVLLEHCSLEETAQEFSLSVSEVKESLARARDKLYRRRAARPRPHLDDKMITAWNGMMLSAISRAAAVLGDPAYLTRATQAGQFLRTRLTHQQSGRLYRAAYAAPGGDTTLGPHPIPGFCDDYAWSIRGLLCLYEATLDQDLLEQALRLQGVQDELFWDQQDGAYYSTQHGEKDILLRMKEDHDGAEPCVNSVSAGNLLRLHRLFEQKSDLLVKCKAILRVFKDRLDRIPVALPELTTVQLMMEEPTQQVILSGTPGSKVLQDLVRVVHHFPNPNRVLLVAPPDDAAPLYKHNPSLLNYKPTNKSNDKSKDKSDEGGAGKSGAVDPSKDSDQVLETAKAYVCHNFTCSLPMTKPEQLRKNLEKTFKIASAESN